MRNKTINNLKYVWKYFKVYKLQLFIFCIITFFLGILSIFSPLITAKIITNITSNKLKIVLYLGLILFILNIFIQFLTYINNKIYFKFQGSAVKNIRMDYCRNILDIQTKTFEEKGSGMFLNRFQTDLVTFSYIFSQLINNMNSIIINIGIYIVVFFINFYIGLYFIISSILLFTINKIKMKNRNEIWREYKFIDERNQSIFQEMLRGFRDLKVLNLQNGMLEYVNNYLDKNRVKSYQMDMINTKYDFLDRFFQNTLRFIFLVLCFLLVNNNSLSVENFLVLFVYQDRIYSAINSIAHLTTEINLFNLCSDNILEILGNTGLSKESYGNKSIKYPKGELVFNNVSFSYNKDYKLLENINFKINPKEKVAIIGKSGAGKSTIINLISKLYYLDEGEILIDGININDLDKNSLRDSISVITQNPYIFNLTIKENLLLARENISDEEIIEKCKLVKIHDFISSLPNGYDTLLEENGVNLSGGQKQRLTIARALLRNSKIIIFDEATNSLDQETQNAVKESINLIKKRCTLIIISHSLNTITDCDKIILLDDGKIIQEGKHKDLIRDSELYKKLYNTE